MKNIIEILKGMGIEVPEDKKADLNKEVNENYKTVAEFDKKLEKAESERDKYKEQAESAEKALKAYDGKDPEALQKEIDSWKEKAEQIEKDYNAKLEEREKQDLLKEAFADVKFTSEAAKKAIMAEIAESVQVKNGKLIGFNDLLEDAKKNDASAFVDEQQEQAKQGAAKFTTKISNNTTGSTATKESIMNIKDRVERQNAIAENLSLFNG